MSRSADILPTSTEPAELLAVIAELRAALEEERARVAQLTEERDQLRRSHERLREELELFRRRIYVATAERVDTRQLELEFAARMVELNKLDEQLEEELAKRDGEAGASPRSAKGRDGRRPKPTGRRDLKTTNLPKERVEITDPILEGMVAEGKAKRMGFAESCRLGWRPGGNVCIVVARAQYEVAGDSPGKPLLVTAERPKEAVRSMAAPSALARIVTEKFADGLPLNRIQNRFAREGLSLDRGTMSRWLEDAGATFGATVVAAARKEAMESSFCIATDATGVRVLPGRSPEKTRRPCRKGHFFVFVADRDHVFFEYTPRETSAVVAGMFKGYSGYVQADAKAVFDVLYVSPEERLRRLRKRATGDDPDVDDCQRAEVGCWSHCRRGFWEAAVTKNSVAREGLVRIGRLFDLEERWCDRPPDEIKELRNTYARPHVESFFAWVEREYARLGGVRSLLSQALGYARRNKDALMRYLDDGRLVLDNNRSERALRSVATGRKGWLFVGSDDHGTAAANLLSGVASARLHGLDPQAYFRDVFRVLGYWPRDRYLELAPKYWAATRARLDPEELRAEVGPLTVPPPLPVPEQ
jgi:transposase